MPYLHCDVETRSAIPIADCGSHRYINDPSFSLLLLSYAIDDGDVKLVDFTRSDDDTEFRELLYDPAYIKVAWNASFERGVFTHVYGDCAPPEQWRDAMVLAASCGLPLSLGQCSAALCLPQDAAKDKAGRDLIRRFCVPKKDGSFNDPAADPERWAQFCEYNRQDVVAERTIFHMLEEWMPDETEHRLWCLDARINERGVRVDRTLAAHASEMDERFKAELTEKAIALTGLDNPGSVTQVKRWLREQEGLDVMSLNKKAVADVVAQLRTEEAKEFMHLRSMLSKTSASKYDAMLRCSTDADPHVHGTMQFFGAHTGRWAGRLLQVQNLPQNHLPDLAEARELVRAGDYETLKCLYDNVPGVLSELIRTGIVPEPGCRLVVADFSAIEARVTAWLAGEEWRMEVFRNGGDIYCASASQMFHVPVVKHGENGDLRQKGKVAELACIAEGQPVLTKRGLVPIQKVRLDDLVWDGAEWVAHDGVVCRGEKEVIRYGDLTATPDHLVFIEGADQPVRFELAAASGARLLRGDDRRTAVWEDSDYLFGEAMVPGLESLLCSDEMHNLRAGELDQLQLSPARKDAGVPELLAAEGDSALARPENHSAKAALHESEGSGIQELRSEGNNFRLPVCESRGALGDRESWSAGGTDGVGPNRERQGLRSGESPLGNALTEQPEHSTNGATSVEPGGMAIQRERCTEENETGLEPRADSKRRTLSCRAEAKELAGHQGVVRRTSRVYDIINCGPRHRFTVSGVLVHNCGYGGGIGALKAFGGDKPWRDSKGVEHPGMTEEEMGEIVGRWRESSPKIVALWKKLERAASLCAARHTAADTGIHGIRYEWERGIMWLRLPSGRRMAYFNAEYRDFPRRVGTGKCLTYMVLNQTTRKWERVETFGGRLVENCFAAGTLVLTRGGWKPIDRIHGDELVWDGEAFVETAGSVFTGRRETIALDGVRVTPDHKILTKDGWTNALSCEGLDRLRVQLPADHWPGGDADRRRPEKVESPLFGLRFNPRNRPARSAEEREDWQGRFVRLFDKAVYIRGEDDTRDVKTSGLCGLALHDTALHRAYASVVEELRWAWHYRVRPLAAQLRELLGGHGADIPEGARSRPAGQLTGVLSGELPLGYEAGELREHAVSARGGHSAGPDVRGGAVEAHGDWENHTDLPAGSWLPDRYVVDETRHTEPVFDLLNCGPRHRFVVLTKAGPMIVHNCVQAIARDCLREAMLNLEHDGWDMRFTVHDEIVCSEPVYSGRGWERMAAQMAMPIDWAPGLLLRADGYECEFYQKD